MKTIKKVTKAQRGIDVERAANQRGVCGKGSVSDRQAARMDRRAERESRREERRYDREARREERRSSRESGGGSSFGSGWKNGGSMAKKKPSMKKGGSFPDLNKDGKVTKADVLVGRGVIKAKKGTSMKMKKQAATAIAMKKAGKAPKKAMMGTMTKKCAYGCK